MEVLPATWNTASVPWLNVSITASGVVRSPSLTSTSSGSASTRSVGRHNAVTCQPSETRRSVRWRPTKPAAPVTYAAPITPSLATQYGRYWIPIVSYDDMVSTAARRRTRPTRAETRQRVLDAAAHVFETQGFDKTSLDDIAARAGLTKGAVYSSFRTKRELFAALIDRQIEERLCRVSDAAAKATTQADAAHAIAAAVTAATYGDTAWHVTFLEFWTKAMRTPALRQSLADQRRRTRDIIAKTIRQHADARSIELSLPPATLALTILALSNGLAVEQLLDTDQADPSLLEDILSVLMSRHR